ncbi:MAG: hypothetical protein RSC64_00930 [Hydrogenoanaerobacterium sp.]
MKQGMIYKGFLPDELTKEDLEKINRYTRRELKAEELYVFPLTLCDNEVDRDFEKFSVEALTKLRRLFLGKTGIFDHNPKGENQTARIYETAVEKDPMRKTSDGEEYHFLTAKAYMVRSEKNRDLILDIDAGIKKEVSVGCAVSEVICSICGANAKEKTCEHLNGKSYGGKSCYFTLQKPTDAYEWSFVAVPSQQAAGVTKAYGTNDEHCESLDELCCKLSVTEGGFTLAADDAKRLGKLLKSTLRLAEEGENYRNELKKEVLCAATLAGGISPATLGGITEKLNTDELRELKKTFAQRNAEAPSPQILGENFKKQASYDSNSQFKI